MTDTTTQADIAKAEFALLKAKVEELEAKASNDWAKVKAAIKANVPHFVTWAGLAATLAHQLGMLRL